MDIRVTLQALHKGFDLKDGVTSSNEQVLSVWAGKRDVCGPATRHGDLRDSFPRRVVDGDTFSSEVDVSHSVNRHSVAA